MQLSKGKNSFTPETRRVTTKEKELAMDLLVKFIDANSEPTPMGFIACFAGIAIDRLASEHCVLKLSSQKDAAESLYRFARNKMVNNKAWNDQIEAAAEELNSPLRDYPE